MVIDSSEILLIQAVILLHEKLEFQFLTFQQGLTCHEVLFLDLDFTFFFV